MSENQRKPDIDYPCRWQYRLIGEDKDAILTAISEALGEAANTSACTISEGNVSSGGRYRTLSLETPVNNEEERLRLHRFFSTHPAIRVVL